MQGVSVNERSRELTHMNKFSEKSVALLVADTIRLSRDGSRRGRLSHGAAFSVELSRIMHLDSRGLFPLPFPAAQPASAPAGRDEDVHAGPDFGRRAALEMLMRTKVIVEASCVGQGSIQRHSVLNGMPEEQPFDGPMRRSTRPFCQGHPGSLCCWRIPMHHRARRRGCDVKTASLSVRKNRGQP